MSRNTNHKSRTFLWNRKSFNIAAIAQFIFLISTSAFFFSSCSLPGAETVNAESASAENSGNEEDENMSNSSDQSDTQSSEAVYGESSAQTSLSNENPSSEFTHSSQTSLAMSSPSSSDYDYSSEILSAQCRDTTIIRHRKAYYTWIQWNADNARDTIIDTTLAQFPGDTPLPYYYSGISIFLSSPINIEQPGPLYQHCPSGGFSGYTDTLYQYDTTYLAQNFSDSAQYELVRPEVSFTNKDSLLNVLPQLSPENDSRQYRLAMTHFQGDEISMELNLPNWLELSHYRDQNCDTVQIDGQEEVLCTISNSAPYHYSLRTLPENMQSGSYQWSVIIRNRFGYADTLSMETLIQ
jgi:hypothetical protein